MIDEETGPESGTPAQHRVHRSRSNRVIAGVCGGLGAYLGIDPVLLRLAFVGLVFLGGGGVLLYILAWIVIPEESGSDEVISSPLADHQARLLVGGALIALGALLLGRVYLSWIDARVLWAVVLMGVGAVIVMKGLGR